MAAFLIPISMFTRSYVYSIPMLLQSLPIYFFAFFVAFKFLVNSNTVSLIPINYTVIRVFAFVLVTQLIMILYSFSISDRKSLTSGLATGPINVFLILGNICLVYSLIYLTVDSTKTAQAFFKSIIWTVIAFFILVLLPQIIATRSSVLNGWVNFLGKTIEAHHKGRTFYDNGSYVTTLHRVNGLDPEASFFAVKIGVIFVPVILASLKNRYDILSGKLKRHLSLYWTLLILLMITLFFAKTSTGMVVIGLTVITLFFVVPKQQRYWLWCAIIAGFLMVILLYFTNSYVHNLLEQYLFNKSGTSNRLGGTIALFRTFLHYPFFGVGSGYTSYYNFKYVPQATTHNFEFENVYMKLGYPDLSVMGSILASFGLIVAIPLFIFVKNKLKKAKQVQAVLRTQHSSDACFVKTVIDSFYFYLIYLIVLSFLSFNLQDEIYLVMLMFYIQVINQATKRLQSDGKEGVRDA